MGLLSEGAAKIADHFIEGPWGDRLVKASEGFSKVGGTLARKGLVKVGVKFVARKTTAQTVSAGGDALRSRYVSIKEGPAE